MIHLRICLGVWWTEGNGKSLLRAPRPCVFHGQYFVSKNNGLVRIVVLTVPTIDTVTTHMERLV